VMCDLLVAGMEAMRKEIQVPDSVPESRRECSPRLPTEHVRALPTTLVAACLTMGHGESS